MTALVRHDVPQPGPGLDCGAPRYGARGSGRTGQPAGCETACLIETKVETRPRSEHAGFALLAFIEDAVATMRQLAIRPAPSIRCVGVRSAIVTGFVRIDHAIAADLGLQAVAAAAVARDR